MLTGSLVSLRLVEERDLAELYRLFADADSRGPYFPVSLKSMSELRRCFNQHGFWSRHRGSMIISSTTGQILGWTSFFRSHPVTDALELSYLIFEEDSRNRGYATESLQLLVEFLFLTRTVQRLELNIVTGNHASLRVAQKNGFQEEGVRRSIWYSPALGTRTDAVHLALLRSDWEARDAPGSR